MLLGRCYDLAETPPYGPWAEALARAPRDPAPPPDLGGADVASQAALFAAVRDFLAALAAQRPLALLLEDLHWADPASLDLLRVVAHGLADVPLLLLATYRPEEVGRDRPLHAILPHLVREGGAARVGLRPLADDDLRALVAARYGLPLWDEARLVAYLRERAGGNPFYAGELLRALEEAGALREVGGGRALGALAGLPVPTLLRQVLDGRLARMGAAAELSWPKTPSSYLMARPGMA